MDFTLAFKPVIEEFLMSVPSTLVTVGTTAVFAGLISGCVVMYLPYINYVSPGLYTFCVVASLGGVIAVLFGISNYPRRR